MRFFIFFICSVTFLFSIDTKTIDKKILKNKRILQAKIKQKKITNNKLKNLADAIKAEENIYNDLEYNLKKVSNNILLNKLKLQNSKRELVRLKQDTNKTKNAISQIEEKIVNNIVKDYSLTLGKSLINKNSLDSIIQKEKYALILDNTKEKILELNLQYFKLSNDKRRNEKKQNELENFIKQQLQEKIRYKKLKAKQAISLKKLKQKYKQYQEKLEFIIKKQNSLNNLLTKLKIIKKETIKKEKERKRLERLKRLRELKAKKEKEERLKKQKLKAKKVKFKSQTQPKSKEVFFKSKKRFKENIDLKVKNIGSTLKGIQISSYYGKKTIAPLKHYKIVKKFGEYYDPIYKIKLFNDSISLKSTIPNAKVYSVFKGKVVYAKYNTGELGNVVIIKHKNNLHTIYSQLSKIPKSIRVGQWIKKGYVIGRVKDILVFQVTKDNRYVDPIKLIKGSK